MALWEEHIRNFPERERLAKAFNFKNVDLALENLDSLRKTLGDIESLISSDLVTITKEQKNEKELLADLEKLKDRYQIDRLNDRVILHRTRVSAAAVRELMHDTYALLQVELHLIRTLKESPSRAGLLGLFDAIAHREWRLCYNFRKETFHVDSQHIHARIMEIARAVLLEQEIEEQAATDAERFEREMYRHMHQESTHAYRKLAEDIFARIAQRAGAPFSGTGDADASIEGVERFHKIMESDSIMRDIVEKLRPEYNKMQIDAVIAAFRRAYREEKFRNLITDFVRS